MARARTTIAFITLLSTIVATGTAVAQAKKDVTFQSLDTLPQGPTPQVIGGNPAPAGKWPATLVFRTTTGSCTATAVGPKAILTAAHCMPDGSQAFIATATQGGSVVCNHHPKYLNDISADFALCLSAVALATPADGFERVNTDEKLVRLNQKVQILGYGCLTEGGNDHNFGTLYEGFASVTSTTVLNPNYIITGGGAAVCFGDSGGGAFVQPGPGQTFRRLIGVNSRGDISANSWLSVTHKPDFIDWAKDWAAKRSVIICGLDQDPSCRQ